MTTKLTAYEEIVNALKATPDKIDSNSYIVKITSFLPAMFAESNFVPDSKVIAPAMMSTYSNLSSVNTSTQARRISSLLRGLKDPENDLQTLGFTVDEAKTLREVQKVMFQTDQYEFDKNAAEMSKSPSFGSSSSNQQSSSNDPFSGSVVSGKPNQQMQAQNSGSQVPAPTPQAPSSSNQPPSQSSSPPQQSQQPSPQPQKPANKSASSPQLPAAPKLVRPIMWDDCHDDEGESFYTRIHIMVTKENVKVPDLNVWVTNGIHLTLFNVQTLAIIGERVIAGKPYYVLPLRMYKRVEADPNVGGGLPWYKFEGVMNDRENLVAPRLEFVGVTKRA